MASWGPEPVELVADGDTPARTLGVPPGAFAGVTLPRRLIVKSRSGAHRLVGTTRVTGGDAESVLRAPVLLIAELAPEASAQDSVPAWLSRARLRDLYVHLPARELLGITGAFAGFCALVLGAVAGYLTSDAPAWLGLLVLAAGCLAGALKLLADLRDMRS